MKRFCALVAIAAAAMMLLPPSSQAVQRVKGGTLSCDVSAGIGLIVGSQKQVTCLFTPAEPGPREVYVGSITKFGLDLGVTGPGQMAWAVYAPTSRRFGALTGEYAGATAAATVGAGGKVNVLLGGSDRTISLQPLSIESQAGINLAAGVAGLELRPGR